MAKRYDALERIKQSVTKRAPREQCIVISSGTCGRAKGSDKVVRAFHASLEKRDLWDKVDIKVTGCHGFCQVEPLVTIQPEGIAYVNVTPEDVDKIIDGTVIQNRIIKELSYTDPSKEKKVTYKKDIPFYKKQRQNLLAKNSQVDPTVLGDYFAIGGYTAFAKALFDMTPESVIDAIKKSGLRGRGGAGFPTGYKWDFCRRSKCAAKSAVKYVICNADEGDPGAYMDRSLLEGNPHSIIEGMLIGGYAIGARKGYVYVRHEYPLAVENITRAVEQAKECGLLGEGIMGTDFTFKIDIVQGAGAFVCGEETALIASIEGKKGEPRQRPPFPATRGVRGRPTNINNVETWANVPLIITKGDKWYSRIGTEGSKGTKIFSLVGKINNTGLVEVPMGISLRDMVFEIGGGIPKGKRFKAVQTGGPSGGCIPESLIDLPVDYEKLSEVGSIMGSGGMVVMDEDTCMVDVARYFLDFLKDESCGKCLTCREGIERMLEIVTDIAEGRGRIEDLATLEELAEIVKDTTMCGLGQTAPNPVISTLRHFRDEYEEHILFKRCRAAVCKEIISSPCQHTCPIGTEVPAYVACIARGEFKQALELIVKDNPLPSVCGRVCNYACESKCELGRTGSKAVAIRALKRFATDYGLKKKITYGYKKAAGDQQKRVAIIGSGPAGLSAGWSLALKGHEVTIFEAEAVLGGWLSLGIPSYRLPRDVLNNDIQNILDLGVDIRTNTRVGKDIAFDQIANEHDCVFIATGAHASRSLGIDGEDLGGIVAGTQFLKDVNLNGGSDNIGKNVCIIGGGNAALDAARVANRMEGCERVTIVYRRTRNEMPALREEIDGALEEGIDIKYLATPVRILTKDSKTVSGIECLNMRLGDIDKSGRRRPLPIYGSEFKIVADTVIIAIGEKIDVSFLEQGEGEKIELTKWGAICSDSEVFTTSRENVFAGGDVVTGPGTVIAAIAAGKRAAESMERYLSGRHPPLECALTRPSVYVEPVELTEEEAMGSKPLDIPTRPADKRKKNFREVELGLNRDTAVQEAKRCLRCDLETREGKEWIEARKERK